MIRLALAAQLFAQSPAPCNVAAAIEEVRSGAREAYDCLRESDSAASALLTEIRATESPDPRVTRALTMWLLARSDVAFDPALVGALPPVDRRLLADGVRARRGRKSPVPEHHLVFLNFDWYKPLETYTDGRLRPVDRANIALCDAPKPTNTVAPPKDTPSESPPWLAVLLGNRTPAEALEAALPLGLALVGIAGAIWFVRKPKA